MKLRNIAAGIFNDMIADVNEKWDKTGEPATFGNYLEAVNLKYVKFIREQVQPEFDALLPET